MPPAEGREPLCCTDVSLELLLVGFAGRGPANLLGRLGFVSVLRTLFHTASREVEHTKLSLPFRSYICFIGRFFLCLPLPNCT